MRPHEAAALIRLAALIRGTRLGGERGGTPRGPKTIGRGAIGATAVPVSPLAPRLPSPSPNPRLSPGPGTLISQRIASWEQFQRSALIKPLSSLPARRGSVGLCSVLSAAQRAPFAAQGRPRTPRRARHPKFRCFTPVLAKPRSRSRTMNPGEPGGFQQRALTEPALLQR